MMEFEYDKEVDAAYIYLEDVIEDGQVHNTVELKDIIRDYDKQGKLIGIEILNASKVLKEEALKE